MNTKLLRQKVLDLAIHGKLLDKAVVEALENTPGYEPASKLLERISGESLPLATAGKPSSAAPSPRGKAPKTPSAPIIEDAIPFEIPENWCWCRLKDICLEFIVPQRDKPTSFDGDIPWCRIEDIEGKYLNGSLSNQLVTRETIKQMNMHICPIGTVICSCSATLGVQAITTVECCTNQTFIGIYGNSQLLNNEYLYYFLKSKTKYFHEIGTGTTIKYVSRDKFEQMPFPLPPLEEQKLIIEEIERIFALIDTVEQNKTDLETVIKQTKSKILDLAIHGKLVPQDKADEPASKMLEKLRTEKEEKIANGQLKRDKNNSYIYKSDDGKWYERKADGSEEEIEVPFEIPESWSWCRLGNLGQYKKGPFGSALTKSMFVPKGDDTIKVYEQKNAIQKNYSLGDYYITREYYESNMKSFSVSAGDILVSCAGTIGETYILPENIEPGIINQALMKMTITKKINITYFLYYFDHILKEASIESGKGTAIKNIPPFAVFKNFLFPLPPVEEQKRIVNKIKESFEQLDSILNSLGV